MPTEYVEVLVKFPKLETADASDLQKLFPNRDGIWSDLTQWARDYFGVDKVDLNENWAGMSRHWRCRGCDREKLECLYASPEGIIFAHLEEHHDHLADRPQDLFRERFGSKWIATANRQFGLIEPMITRLIQRFNPTFVCQDCNGADALIQAKYNLPKHFSFTPREIRQFITPTPHKPHQINYPKALALYESLQDDLETRLSLLDHLMTLVDAGYLKQERGLGEAETPDWDLRLDRHLHRCHRSAPLSRVSDIERDLKAFKSLSLSRAAAGQSKKRKTTKPLIPPTIEEFEAHDGSGDLELWHLAEADWICPGCRRSKFETLKPSKNKTRKWSSKLFRHTETIWGDRIDPFTAEWGQGFTHVESHLLCQDCATLGAILKSQEPTVAHLDFRFQFDDIVAITIVEPHTAHLMDKPKAIARAIDLAKGHDQVEAFERLYDRGCAHRRGYLDALENAHGDEALAFHRQIEFWSKAEKTSYADMKRYLRILITEADRLDKSDPGLRYVRRYPPLTSLDSPSTPLPPFRL